MIDSRCHPSRAPAAATAATAITVVAAVFAVITDSTRWLAWTRSCGGVKIMFLCFSQTEERFLCFGVVFLVEDSSFRSEVYEGRKTLA